MQKSSIYQLFVDLDGVLVDFNSLAYKIAGIRPSDVSTDKKAKSRFWSRINHHAKTNPFFSAMQPMEDAFTLWQYIERHNPTICSATGSTPNAEAEKRLWVKNHLGAQYATDALIVSRSADKARYAHATHILIDDRRHSVDPWIQAGGIAILHTDAESTISELSKLGL